MNHLKHIKRNYMEFDRDFWVNTLPQSFQINIFDKFDRYDTDKNGEIDEKEFIRQRKLIASRHQEDSSKFRHQRKCDN